MLAFLDIKSAYDRVDHAILWDKCKACGIKGQLLSILQSLFSGIAMSVVVRGERSYTIRPRCGLLQGSILSPLLFSIFIDDLPKELAAAAPGCVVGDGIVVNSLLFADDVVLIAKTPADMQLLLDTATEHAVTNKYLWNPTKSVVIDTRDDTSYTLVGTRLEHVSSFPYLGVICTASGIDRAAQTQIRVTKATRVAHILRGIGMNARGLHPYPAAILWKAFGRSSMEYGSAAYLMRAQDRKLCDKLQNQVHRWIFGSGKTGPTQAMRIMTNTQETQYRNRELNAWFLLRYSMARADCLSGHVWRKVMERRPKGSLLRQAAARNPLWKKLKEEGPDRRVAGGVRSVEVRLDREQKQRWRTAEILRCRNARGGELTRGLAASAEGDHWLRRWSWMRRYERELLMRWRLGRRPGKPMECTRCGVAGKRTTREHVL